MSTRTMIFDLQTSFRRRLLEANSYVTPTHFVTRKCFDLTEIQSRRSSIQSFVKDDASYHQHKSSGLTGRVRQENNGLHRLSTVSFLRNILLGTFFSSPIIAKPGFALLRKIADSKSTILNADRNPVLRAVLKPLFYNQFCAGVNAEEIQRTKAANKKLGYSGVILCYGKEIQISRGGEAVSTGVAFDSQAAEIEHFKNGNLETLDMVDAGDWLGLKISGAGSLVTKALIDNANPPPALLDAMDAILQKAAAKNCRVWVDAEQQVLQAGIDKLTIDLMRKHNTNGKAILYNTVQAYLKASRTKLKHQLKLSHGEGWALGVKLVRGAYLDNDKRELIHDTKVDTDNSYNGIVRDILSGTNLGFPKDDFPQNVNLFLAGHNPESIGLAWNLIQTLSQQGQLKVLPDLGQLQGMGDVVSCRLLSQIEETQYVSTDAVVPKIYKCLTWGSVEECLQYLFRRAVENSGGTDRMKDGLAAYYGELKRRLRQQESK